MEAFCLSIFNAESYPRNLLSIDESSHNVKEYHQRLLDDDERLFGIEESALVDCLELEDSSSGTC